MPARGSRPIAVILPPLGFQNRRPIIGLRLANCKQLALWVIPTFLGSPSCPKGLEMRKKPGPEKQTPLDSSQGDLAQMESMSPDSSPGAIKAIQTPKAWSGIGRRANPFAPTPT
jgi:hypothetical protein